MSYTAFTGEQRGNDEATVSTDRTLKHNPVLSHTLTRRVSAQGILINPVIFGEGRQ